MINDALKIIFLICFLSVSFVTAQLKDGIYQGYSVGRTDQKYDGKISVEVKVTDGKLDSIKLKTFNQNLNHKKYGLYVQQVFDELPKKIIKSQSIDIDIITGATITSNALLLAVGRAVQESFPRFKDGTYSGSAIGRRDKEQTGEIVLDVTIFNSRIDSIQLNIYNQSIEHKIYGAYTLNAKKEIPSRIIDSQSLLVDGISGATISSNAILLALSRALEKAK